MTENTRDSILKFFLFASIFFILIVIGVFLRDLKDVLIITSENGASLLSGLKIISFCFKLIVLALFFLFYRQHNLLQIMFTSIIVLLLIFIVFHFFVYPFADYFHPSSQQIQQAIQKYPDSQRFVLAYGLWTYSLYFLFAELWETFVLVFLFWAVANQNFTTREAKLAYPLLLFVAALGFLIGTVLTRLLTDTNGNLANIIEREGYILLGGFIIFVICAWIIKKYHSSAPSLTSTDSFSPIKFSLKFNAVYLFYIFIILTSFGVCHQLINYEWKNSLKHYYKSAESLSAFSASYPIYLGGGSIALFLLTFWMIWKLGWLRSALIPPLMTLGTTLILVLYNLIPALDKGTASFFNIPSLSLDMWMLTIQMIMLKGLVTLFLATKEIAYIPLAMTTKVRGKAIIDFLFGGFGDWLGKLWIILFLTFDFIPINKNMIPDSFEVFIIVCIISIVWIISVIHLGRMYEKIIEPEEK